MLSRASALPRICLSCRLSIVRARAPRRRYATADYTAHQIRRYSSKHASDSAAAYEAKLLELVNSEYYNDFLVKKDLDLESLGKPVSALIIKNPNEMRSRPLPLPVVDEEAPSSGTPLRVDDVLAQDDESDPETLETAMKNIDDLRPYGTDALKLWQVEKLVGALNDGFTWQQLRSYCAARSQRPRSWAKEAKPYTWIVHYQPWEAIRMVQVESLTPKRQIAARIITEVWNMGVQEQVRGPGKMLVWLRPPIFQLLFHPSSPLLHTLTTECLGGSTKWKIIPSARDSRLEIYGPKATARAVLARIDNMIRAIVTRTVTVRSANKDMSRTVLNELERVTNTLLQYSDNESELSISWVADSTVSQSDEQRPQEASARQQTEDPAGVVLRLLMAQRASPASNKLQIIPSVEREQLVDEPRTFVGHHRGNRALSWNDKMLQWSRLANPANRRDPATARSRVSIFDKLSLPRPIFRTREGVSVNAITANFGHILHYEPTHRFNANKRRRVLSPVVPHPASFTSVGVASDKPVTQSISIILNFAPEETPSSPKGRGAPSLRLKLPVNPGSDLSRFTSPPNSVLEGVYPPWHMRDVLLPDELVDVRLIQQRVRTLAADQPSLKEFLDASEFNLLEGKLRTPSHTNFSVPESWLPQKLRSAETIKLEKLGKRIAKANRAAKSPKGAKATNIAKSGEPSGPDDPEAAGELTKSAGKHIDVPYLFVGLEIHQTVDLELNGHTLRYNSIEAGHQGGQRQEISLLTTSKCRTDKPKTAEQEEEFLQAVENVAFGNLFSWHKGNKMVQDHRCVEDLDWEAAMEQQVNAGEAEPPAATDAPPPPQTGAREAQDATAKASLSRKGQMAAPEALEPPAEKEAPSPWKPAAARGVEDPDWVTQLRSMARRD